MESPPPALIKFQIGPVQDFIAAARSTRDLWSGSYLLSLLVAAGIRAIPNHQTALIFPNPKGQPLLKDTAMWQVEDPKSLLTPNLPNLFVAKIAADQAEVTAEMIKKAVEAEWEKIYQACFDVLKTQRILNATDEDAFVAQASGHLSISYQITPFADGYQKTYQRNGWQLDAVRQTRNFQSSLSRRGERDSLTGTHSAFAGGAAFQKDMAERRNPYSTLFKHSDQLGAITLIKRVWHLGYLGARPEFQAAINSFNLRSTRAIAARDDSQDDAENTDGAQGEKYLATIAFDGDSIGKWMNGDDLTPGHDLHQHHQDFSAALSDFALNKVREIIEKKCGKGLPIGFLIYAGGDDVVALVPADVALTVAGELRAAFRKATAHIQDKFGNSPDASVGIAIAHFKSPLQDLIREGQKAEKDAKRDQGRAAFSITLLKRSGEISKWGGKWDHGPIALYEAIFKAMENGLSRKFPHRVCQLLEPYLTGSSKQTDVPNFPLHEVVEKEIAHAAIRQGSREIAATLLVPLRGYLKNLPPDPKATLQAIISLCTTLAFTLRNLPQPQATAEGQPA